MSATSITGRKGSVSRVVWWHAHERNGEPRYLAYPFGRLSGECIRLVGGEGRERRGDSVRVGEGDCSALVSPQRPTAG